MRILSLRRSGWGMKWKGLIWVWLGRSADFG